MKISKYIRVVSLVALGAAIMGCENIGNAPSGGSPAEIESNFKKQDPQEQIKIIQGSPADPARKAELIKAIEDKYGIKAGQSGPSGSAANPMANVPGAGK